MAKLGWLTGNRPEPYYLASPSVGIQRALGGSGFASGRFHLYWGSKASGKTTFALQQIAAAQRQGKTCAYIDSEKAYDTAWAIKNGVDTEKLLYQNSQVAEEILALLLPEMANGKIDVVVIDSLNSINFEAFFDIKDPSKTPIGSYARASKMITHKILGVLNHEQEVIFISHAAMDLSGYRPMLKAAVGNAVEHWASTVVKFQKMSGADHVREDGSFRVKWKIEKSKQSNYPVAGEYFFNPLTAEIDVVGEIAIAAVEAGLVETAGAWHYYPNKETCGDNRWQGAAKFLAELKSDMTLRAEITEKLNAIGLPTLEEDVIEDD